MSSPDPAEQAPAEQAPAEQTPAEQAPAPARWGLPLRAWLVLSYLLVLALPLLAFVLTGALAMDLIRQTRLNLENQGELVALFVGERLHEAGAPADVAALGPTLSQTLQAARERTLAGIRILDARGTVIASSGAGVGVDLSEDPEVAIALTGPGVKLVPPAPASTATPAESKSTRSGSASAIMRAERSSSDVVVPGMKRKSGAPSVPSPKPRKTRMFEKLVTTATSGLVSPSKSSTTRLVGEPKTPAPNSAGAPKPPLPSPRSTVM